MTSTTKLAVVLRWRSRERSSSRLPPCLAFHHVPACSCYSACSLNTYPFDCFRCCVQSTVPQVLSSFLILCCQVHLAQATVTSQQILRTLWLGFLSSRSVSLQGFIDRPPPPSMSAYLLLRSASPLQPPPSWSVSDIDEDIASPFSTTARYLEPAFGTGIVSGLNDVGHWLGGAADILQAAREEEVSRSETQKLEFQVLNRSSH